MASTVLYRPRDPAHPRIETDIMSRPSTTKVHDRTLDSSRMGESLASPKMPRPKSAMLASLFY